MIIGLVCPPYMVHPDLVGLWVVLLWPPVLTHGPLSYLVLSLLLCVYPCHDDSHLMGFFGTLFFWLDYLLMTLL